MAWSTPEWTIVSGGYADHNAEVTEAFTSQGSAVLNTADYGAVSATIAGGQVSVEGFNPRH